MDNWLFRQTNPNKPNLSQNKPNSKPIYRKAKIDAKSVYTKDYEEKCGYGPKKTKPIQSQSAFLLFYCWVYIYSIVLTNIIGSHNFRRLLLMKKITLICSVLLIFCLSSAKYTPTSDYTVRKIEGWKILINNELLTGHPQLAKDTLKLLRFQLYQITRVVPKVALKEIRQIPVWVEYKAPRHQCMCYHPSKQWLTNNDFNPEKAKSVEIANAENFLKWTIGQPWMVLHELAHSYHHCILGYDNKQINQAFRKAVESKKYESVLHIAGKPRLAYALNNDQEYFAECSEAFFGTNDFYPFVRAELQQHDPDMYQVLKELWKVK
jgi:hypothetical protein